MAGIGTPFSFVNPARFGIHPPPSSSYQRARPTLPRAPTSFSRFSQLPAELRLEIIRLSIEEAVDHREKWLRGQHSPVVLQSRRGVLRVQPQHRQPPSLPELAGVSIQWQEEIEKQLFETLHLKVLPDWRSAKASDLVEFAAIVTGPRRRYLIELHLESYDKILIDRGDVFRNGKFYRISSDSKCIMELFQILGTWAPEQTADDLLTVKLSIKLEDFALDHLKTQIMKLPMIPVIGSLYVNMDPDDFSKLPFALLCLLCKLPQLRCTVLKLSPWCSSNENGMNNETQAFLDGLHQVTPLLEILEFDMPFTYRHAERQAMHGNILSGRPVSTIRELSYRLQVLSLGSSIDLPLFFEHFADVKHATHPSWPALKVLDLYGSIEHRSDAKQVQRKDQFLKCVGRAIKFMPEILEACVEIARPPGSGRHHDWMRIQFAQEPLLDDTEKFDLSVYNHTPSSSAVDIWKEATLHTKRMQLGVEFMPTPRLGENGTATYGGLQAWKE